MNYYDLLGISNHYKKDFHMGYERWKENFVNYQERTLSRHNIKRLKEDLFLKG